MSPEYRQGLIDRYNNAVGQPGVWDQPVQRAFILGKMDEEQLRSYAQLCEYIIEAAVRGRR